MLAELLPAVVGTFSVSLLAVIIATPVSIITGIFISEFLTGFPRLFFIFFFKLLAAIPSIIVGLCGFILIISLNQIFSLQMRTSLIVSALSLSILIAPYIVNTTYLTFNSIPAQTRNCALSVGAHRYQNILYVLLPESLIGISSGIILAIGRAAEDTAVIMLTGVAAFSGFPTSLTGSYEALPFFIYYKSAEYSTSTELLQIAIAAILLLIISVGMIFVADRVKHKIIRSIT